KASRPGLRARRGETRFPGPARARLERRPRRGRAGARRATGSARRRAGRTRGEKSAPPACAVRSCVAGMLEDGARSLAIGLLSPQLTAFFASAPILASSAAVNSFSAKAIGHMAPSSRFASWLKPSVMYLSLNFCVSRKKQTTLPSLAYAGIPYQSLGERT